GVSGAGKSTLARQFLGTGTDLLLSDDRIILRRSPQGWTAHGTPWAGDAGVAVNAGVPLRALLFLRQSDRNHVTPLAASEALHRLLRVTSIPWFDAAVLPTALDLCDELIGATPSFEFEFLPEPAAAETLRAFAASEAR
ncbi:MAG TPA: hypothetical protein VK576_00780, partial [Thermoleophilia bacterium]|nr:hypothetical protein [Thermoleophilia bacterium]